MVVVHPFHAFLLLHSGMAVNVFHAFYPNSGIMIQIDVNIVHQELTMILLRRNVFHVRLDILLILLHLNAPLYQEDLLVDQQAEFHLVQEIHLSGMVLDAFHVSCLIIGIKMTTNVKHVLVERIMMLIKKRVSHVLMVILLILQNMFVFQVEDNLEQLEV